MIFTGLVGLLTALLSGSEAPPLPRESVRVMTVEERLTIRVPVAPRPRMKIRWDEEKGPKCLPAEAVRGAYLDGYSYEELAQRFAVPLNTMRTWLRRSLIRLRDCLTA